MMDVTNENFIELLPEILETIKQCDFIAIDTELSGLMRERSINRFDLPEERFAQAVKSSRGYFIMQFGLSCFSRDSSLRSYTNRTYNFYIFPQAHEGLGDVNRTFALQAHAIQFLTEHGFDFNKLFKHGVSYLTFEEKKKFMTQLKNESRAGANRDEKTRDQIVAARGFLEVLEVIIVNKKPLVGHNLLLDLVQIFNQFVEPLTEDYSNFKSVCRDIFPTIYDTKHIAHSVLIIAADQQNQSRLEDLYCSVRDAENLPKIEVKLMNNILDDKHLPHQAGYDAYMSGYAFIALCEARLQQQRKYKLVKNEGTDARPVSLAQDPLIKSIFANKIYLSFCYDFKYYDLNGYEKEPDRSHVYYVEFPKTWGNDNLCQIFSDYGGVTFSRLSRTSALCALRDMSKKRDVEKKAKSVMESQLNYRIFSYETYLESVKVKKELNISGDDNEDSDIR